jgi:hypothetical protein
LRWWNEVTEQGESIWRYESLPQEVKPSEWTLDFEKFACHTYACEPSYTFMLSGIGKNEQEGFVAILVDPVFECTYEKTCVCIFFEIFWRCDSHLLRYYGSWSMACQRNPQHPFHSRDLCNDLYIDH